MGSKSRVNNFIKDLKKLGSPEKAKASAWFFKTGKGEYGYGDKFFGVTVPEERRVAKKYYDLPTDDAVLLLSHQVHEVRLTALFVLVHQYKVGDKKKKEEVARLYIKNAKKINNWDLVDSSASYILGDYLLTHDRGILYRLARSQNLWERRIAIVATGAFIRAGQFEDTLKIAEILISDTHDLIHKATGWMLREVGKRSEGELLGFLNKHAGKMPRTMLRYAIEKLSEAKRREITKKTNVV
jgi:3-methyladenine DNA glycosylase AlkD